MSRNHFVGLLILAFFLTGCVGMPITSMFKLRKMNPMEVDPAQFKVAIRMDERIGIPEDGVHMTLKFDSEDGSLSIDDTYVVEVTRNPILTPELIDDKATWKSVTVLQLTDSDAQKLTGVQSLLRPHSEGQASGSLSFGVDVKGVCTYGPIPAEKVLIDIFVQASNKDGFFAVSRNLDLFQSVDGSDLMLESLSECLDSPIQSDRNETTNPMSSRSDARVADR